MKKVALIQLTRIGDILQTFQAARQLKLENPSLSLSLIARRSMAKDLIFLLKDVFDDLFLFETSDFFPIGTKKFESAKDNLRKFTNELNQENFDLLINFSFTKSSSYLMPLINAKIKMGPQRNYKNELSIPDRWSQYIYSNVLDSNNSAFNLVDIYKNILGAKDNHSFPVEREIRNSIAIHPFASNERKMWTSTKWSLLIKDLLSHYPDFKIDILGAKNEISKVQKILMHEDLSNFKHRINDYVGKTNLEESFNIVNSSRLFIGHDSMVSHLASICEKESLIISLGQVKPHQTAPYNDKAITLSSNRSCAPCSLRTKCAQYDCQDDIHEKLVLSLANKMITTKADSMGTKDVLNTFLAKNLNVLKGSFHADGLRLVNLMDNSKGSQDVLKDFYRVSFAFYLNDMEVNLPTPKLNNEAILSLKQISQGVDFMHELYQHAMISCKKILELSNAKTSEFKKVKNEIKKISEIDQLLRTTIKKFPLLKPVEDFFYVNRVNSPGKDLVEITQSNLISYYEAQNFLTFIEDLTNTSLGPKIVNRNLNF